MRTSIGRSERGQVVPLLAAVIVFAGLAIIAIAHVGGGAVQRAAARRAADAAALAGAAEGRDGAKRLASANDAAISRYTTNGRDAEVVVTYGDARAIARARLDGGGQPYRPGDPAPALRAALARAAQLLHHQPHVVWARGLVVDFTPSGMQEMVPIGEQAGLCLSGSNQMRVCGSH